MPNISKINALAIGSVAKVDGLDKNSILDIDGVAVLTVDPVLDTYTNATAAYSVRLLRTTYTGDCMRVRRASDNVEADVGFNSANRISLTSPISNTSDAQSYADLADFVDHTGTPTDAFVRYWYDQSSNSLDVGQATAGSQPKMYDVVSGLVIRNGTPAMKFDGINDFLDKSTTDSVSGFVSLFTVGTTDSFSGSIIGAGRSVASLGTTTTNGQRRANILWNGGSGTTWYYYTSVYGANNQIALATVNAQYLHSSIFDTAGNQSDGAIDGGTLVNLSGTLNTMTNYTIRVGTSSAGEIWSGYIQEVIAYKLNQTSNRSGIETNLNDFFSIY